MWKTWTSILKIGLQCLNLLPWSWTFPRCIHALVAYPHLTHATTFDWWFGTTEFYDFPYIGNIIIATDFHIFQRGRSTTNQTLCNFYCFKCDFNRNPQFNTTLLHSWAILAPVEFSGKMNHLLPRFSFVRRVWTYLLNPFSPSFSHLLVIKIAMWIYFSVVYLIFRQIHSTTFQIFHVGKQFPCIVDQHVVQRVPEWSLVLVSYLVISSYIPCPVKPMKITHDHWLWFYWDYMVRPGCWGH